MSWQPEPEGPQTEVTLGKAQEPLDLGLLYCIIQGQDGMTSKDFPPVVKGSEGPRVGSPGGSWRGAWCEVCVRGGGGGGAEQLALCGQEGAGGCCPGTSTEPQKEAQDEFESHLVGFGDA